VGIVFALLVSLSQAFGYVALKKSYKELPPSVAFLFDSIFGLLILIPFSLIVGFNFSNLPTVFIYALISAMLSEAYVFYALSKGELSITATIFSSYPLYTILFSFFINHDKPSFVHWIFIILTILGTVIVSLPHTFNKAEFKKKTIILWGVSAAITVGLADSISKNVIDRTSVESFMFALAIVQVPVALVYLRLEKQKFSQFITTIRNYDKYKFAILGSFLNIVAVFFLWLAFSGSNLSIVSPLTAIYPGITILLAYVFLKERIKLKDFIGLIIIVTGVIGISFFYY
jgi:drug/metabolite transporter (DMT)-like permease